MDVRLEWSGKQQWQASAAPIGLFRPGSNVKVNPQPGTLISGDNLLAMEALLPSHTGAFTLIYLDPPFFTNKDWHLAGTDNSKAYTDTWDTGLAGYLQWLYQRLSVARLLLAPTGTLYLHLNWQAVHHARLILDEVFGSDNFQNELIWCHREAINSRKRWNRKHDTILMYSRTGDFYFNPDAVLQPYSETTIKKFRHSDEKGPYRLMGRGITDSPLRSKRDISPEMEAKFPGLTYRHYMGKGTLPVDWLVIDIENQASVLRTGYPTQKPEALLEKILLASSKEGDLVADFCCGSGTTLAVAHRLRRKWFGCDFGEAAINIASQRLLNAGADCQVLVPFISG